MVQTMNLLQLGCIVLSAFSGLFLELAAEKIHPGLAAASFPVALFLSVALPWPLMRSAKVSPIIVWCPACARVLEGPWQPTSEGWAVHCSKCDNTTVFRGDWEERRGKKVFAFYSPAAADILDSEGNVVAKTVARWPYWFVIWRKQA